jgi:hypothetical protein
VPGPVTFAGLALIALAGVLIALQGGKSASRPGLPQV